MGDGVVVVVRVRVGVTECVRDSLPVFVPDRVRDAVLVTVSVAVTVGVTL